MGPDFPELLDNFTGAVEAGDGSALADLFTEDGLYHDTFYGAFVGRSAIAVMLEDRFWRDAESFRWDMFEPVYDDATGTGYARWVFSYTSRMATSRGKRVVFDGMSRFLLENGLICHYREVFSAGYAFVQLGMTPERTASILERMVEARTHDPEWRPHLRG